MPFLKYWIFSFTAYFAFAYIVLDRPPHTLPKKNGEIFAFSNVLLTPWCPAVLASCRYQITTSLIDLGKHIFHFTFPTSISQSKHKTLFLISQHLATSIWNLYSHCLFLPMQVFRVFPILILKFFQVFHLHLAVAGQIQDHLTPWIAYFSL